MLPFQIELRPGLPIADQVVFAVTRAVVGGRMRAGEAFPSVRVLSQELKINPNTAHKIVAQLVQEGILLATPGVGTVVAERLNSDSAAPLSLLRSDLERLAVEARKLGFSLGDVQDALAKEWQRLGKHNQR